MKIFFTMLLIFPSALFFSTNAQRVVRKGMEPKRVKGVPKTIFYNTGQLTGKWQEYTRTNVATGGAVDFRDTLMLNFNKRDSVYVYDGVTMSQRGLASMKPRHHCLSPEILTALYP